MKFAACKPDLATDQVLERMIEPLASYICATDRPRAALISALTALFNEVEQTHQAASNQVTLLAETFRP